MSYGVRTAERGKRRGREGEKKQKEKAESRVTTQRVGSFNKHELEPAAIERYNGKLMQMRADLMKKRKAEGGGKD